MEGIDGDLAVLDTNFRLNGIESIITYDKFTGIPYIKFNNYNDGRRQIVQPKIPGGIGYLAICEDTEGSSFGITEYDRNIEYDRNAK